MGMFDNMSAAAGEVLSGGLGFIGNLGGAIAGGLFSANQAKKNRAFQERMYNKQYQDSIDFWKMQNEYNLPSAQLQRLRDANLNPLLMYGEGGISGNLAQQAPQLPQQPHGAQGQVSSFNTRIELANLALVQAQAKSLEAQAQKDLQEVNESKQRELNFEQDVLLKRLTKDINVAIQYRNYDFLNTSIDEMRNNIFNSSQLRLQNVLTLMQGREYQIKHFNLTSWQVGEQIKQGWEDVTSHRIQANSTVTQAAAAWKSAVSLANLNDAQIGEINQRVYQMKKLFPELEKQTKWMTVQQQTDYFLNFALKGLDISQKQVDIIKSKIGAVRSGLGNDSGIGSVVAPFQMPMRNPLDFYNQYYNGKE